MLLLIAIIAAIFSPTLFVPGIVLILGGLGGLSSDKPGVMMVFAVIGVMLVLASL